MTNEIFHKRATERIGKLLEERSPEIEVFITGLVGLAFCEGIKFTHEATQQSLMHKAMEDRNVALRECIEALQTTFRLLVAEKVKLDRQLCFQMLELCKAALDPSAKGGAT